MRWLTEILLLIFVVSSSHGLPDGSTPAEERFVEALNGFAVRLYKNLASRGGNVFFCPVCVVSSLTMVMEGSRGLTETELNKTLGFKDNLLNLATVREVFTKLNKRMSQNDCLAQMVNALLVQKDPWAASVTLTKGIQDVYNTFIGEVDFLGNPQQVVWDINELVRVRTGGRLRHVFERIDTNNQMIIVNAAYFRTFFKIFEGDITNKKSFYNYGVRDRDVLAYVMEKQEGIHKVATSYDFRALALPCTTPSSESVKFWILLPHKMGSLTEVEHALSPMTFRQTAESFIYQKLNVTIPRIRFDYSKDIIKELRLLGMKHSLSSQTSNYSGISEKKGITLTQVLIKATVEINDIDDEGRIKRDDSIQEALDEASRVVNDESPSPPFDANHPFLFLVIDESTGLILHMGRVIEF